MRCISITGTSPWLGEVLQSLTTITAAEWLFLCNCSFDNFGSYEFGSSLQIVPFCIFKTLTGVLFWSLTDTIRCHSFFHSLSRQSVKFLKCNEVKLPWISNIYWSFVITGSYHICQASRRHRELVIWRWWRWIQDCLCQQACRAQGKS